MLALLICGCANRISTASSAPPPIEETVNAHNLRVMVVDPSDLAGRPGTVKGSAGSAVKALNALLQGNVKPLMDPRVGGSATVSGSTDGSS